MIMQVIYWEVMITIMSQNNQKVNMNHLFGANQIMWKNMEKQCGNAYITYIKISIQKKKNCNIVAQRPVLKNCAQNAKTISEV